LVEVFNFDGPLDLVPDLMGLAPDRVRIASSLNLRNPDRTFGADPFSFGTATFSRAIRYTAALRIPGSDSYTFKLGLHGGGRLSINGNLVVEIPTDTGAFQESTGDLVLSGGLASIEVLAFDNGGAEVQLSYGVSGSGDFGFVPGADLTPPADLFTTASTSDGTFAITNVPTVLGDVAVAASKEIGGRLAKGRSASTAPVPGGSTAVGDVVLKTGGKIGYYDLGRNQGSGAQRGVIQTAGFEAINIGDLNQADLSQVDVLMVQNPDNGGYSQVFLNNLPKIHQFVADGGTLLFHDRHVDSAESILPGSPGDIVRDFSDDVNIDIVDATTLVTDGPGGVLNNASLDGGNSSSHGYINAVTIPAGARGILSTGNPSHLVTYSYAFGQGHVVYSTIPLDFYLGGCCGVAGNMTNYAANVLAYANDLR
jgi:hypothetical protein